MAKVDIEKADIEALVKALGNEKPANYWSVALKDTETGKRILKLSSDEYREVILRLIKRIGPLQGIPVVLLSEAAIELLRKKIPFAHDEILTLINWLIININIRNRSLGSLVKQIELYQANASLTSQLRESIKKLVQVAKSDYSSPALRLQIRELERFTTDELTLPFEAGEAWSDQAIADISALPEAKQRQWAELLLHVQESTSSTPSTKWQKAAQPLLAAIGDAAFQKFIMRWFPLVDKPRTVELSPNRWGPDPNDLLNDNNADILKGLVWLCSQREEAGIARALTTLALSAYRKVPGVGPRSVRVGNACVWALGNMPGMTGIYQLALLQVKVKFGTAQKGIEKALTVAAERENLPREELEELAMPTYGLTDVGKRQEQFGDFTAELSVTGTHTVELTWRKADGKVQRAVPKQVKTDFAEELKELQLAAKDIQKMLPAQRDRIDNLYLHRKSWAYATWRERYLDHPLLGVLARRLIWRFTHGDTVVNAIWHNEHFVDCLGQAIQPFTPEFTVALWHPIDATLDEIVAWRSWLEREEVQQPFKQAHRELYILTDAERRTNTYSNRFAAHILKQHQFNGLCAVRDWRNKLRLMVDDTYPPATKELPAWALRAEYWIEGAGEEYNVDTNEAGVYLRVMTDQVRFYAIESPHNYAHAGGGGYGGARYGAGQPHEPLPLAQVPPLVFSEVMRDVDLFVGVASVGNDPTWSDGGPQGRYRDYWTHYSFGDLSETANTRKAILQHLVPRLKIANRCEIRDRFLVVRGNQRTYKIHLGSSNILMEPNDQYLCIVPGRSDQGDESSHFFLPFEGDRTLATVISKAFLLADDSSITDPSIVRQIRQT